MRFESMNQVLKRMATGSNFINLLKRIAEFWCIKSARDYSVMKILSWGLTEILRHDVPRFIANNTDELVHMLITCSSLIAPGRATPNSLPHTTPLLTLPSPLRPAPPKTIPVTASRICSHLLLPPCMQPPPPPLPPYSPEHDVTSSPHTVLTLCSQVPKALFEKYYRDEDCFEDFVQVGSVRYMGFVLEVGGWVLARPWAWNQWGLKGPGCLARCASIVSVKGKDTFLVLEVFTEIPLVREFGRTGIVVTWKQLQHASVGVADLSNIEELCMLPLHLTKTRSADMAEGVFDWCFTMLK